MRDQVNEAVSHQHRLIAERGRRLLECLVPHFQAEPLRQDKRQPMQHSVRVAVGLDAVRQLVEQRGRQAFDATKTGRFPGPLTSSRPQRAVELSTWRVANESPGGLRLQGSAPSLGDSQSGDLIGVLETAPSDHPTSVNLSVIRWIRVGEDEQFAMGVEHLNAPAVTVDCRTLDDEAESAESIPCLLLSGTRDGAVPTTLLTGKDIYNEGGTLSVTQDGKMVSVRMGKRVMETASFDQFQFEQLTDET